MKCYSVKTNDLLSVKIRRVSFVGRRLRRDDAMTGSKVCLGLTRWVVIAPEALHAALAPSQLPQFETLLLLLAVYHIRHLDYIHVHTND